jgi:hypothetical protein
MLIQIRRFADTNMLPKTIPACYKESYAIMREAVTGGLSIVQHRYNVHNETRINKIAYNPSADRLWSFDTGNLMTRGVGYDFSSLYPSVSTQITIHLSHTPDTDS